MKPLALHLAVILFVGSQLLASATVETTTGQPPSLPSPQRIPVTTMMTPTSLTSSIKLMAINDPTSTTSSTSSNNNAYKKSTAHDQPTNDESESDEDSTTVSARNAMAMMMARGRSIGSRSLQKEPQQRLYQQQRLPAPSSSSSSAQQVQQQYQHQFRRQSESSTGQPAVHQLQATKTPRMIQRLVAGHIQNVPNVVRVSSETTAGNLVRRTPHHINAYRSPKISFNQVIATTTEKPIDVFQDSEDREDDDDAAFLDDPGDFDNWDNGILRLSAGSGKETSTKGKKKDDSKKTLADQVRDGKYGLIEKELFRREPQRPGVISYLPNKEVPIDNERNYGGLNEEDIWLAEDHLLVIKGGSLNEPEPGEPWPPLDDYDAPGRQIKIPPNPKVPPPFPVQLEENGPIQFIGDSKVSIVYPIANESISLYSTGQETQNEPSEADRDKEKNLLTRPGTSGGTEKGQNDPNYFYPKPYPSWLFHNQSFVNPFLNARPIPFPGIGPFLNGSLEAFNGTDFDEDDPSLYYPPPYSFVYKSNYSNPVQPGPLVPGIVLPPPPDAFARLEKPRNKFVSTTTMRTTELPFREILTKISEYSPKTIVVSTPKTIRPYSTTSQPPPQTTSSKLQPIPVQKEIYYSVQTPTPPLKLYPTSKTNEISFVPTTSRQPNGSPPTLSKSNPIYYEYFEARKEHPTTKNYVPEFVSNIAGSQQRQIHKPSKAYSKSKISNNAQYYYSTTTTAQPQAKQQYVSTNRPQFVYEDFVYITPKPEIRPNGISNTNHNYIPYQVPVKVPPLKNNRPYESFEREVSAIRETLRYYQSQQLQDNSIPRTPKSKPIYDYNFETAEKPTNRNFNPPAEYDAEPFKPMVTYSPPVDDENAFRAVAFEKVDNDLPAVQNFYENPTTVEPQLQSRQQKKIRLGAKYIQPLLTPYDEQSPLNYNTATTPRTILTTQKPWITVEKQVVQEVAPPVKSAQLKAASNRGYHGPFQGYYYNPPNRQNNRYYEEPFYPQPTPARKIINQRPTPRPQQHQQQQIWSLENDTYVNYAPNRPPINPDAEFIRPYQPFSQYSQPQLSQAQRLQPAQIQNQNPYYRPTQNRVQSPQQQQQISLHRDTLVNYRQPLPPINPDSEYISIPGRSQSQQQQQQLPLPSYRTPSSVQYRDPSQGGNVYFITPKYRRHSAPGER